ncbi:hypothetical protein M405DRAFT_189347 [Rhizopogon salebrosus TDB-379]|nr:hypothetical protein M405DRAFT_189347 [Rhizopogon salebrosus TDB-379]
MRLDRANSEHLAHPAVYPALFERAISDQSLSHRRGSHLAAHENIKSKVVPPAFTWKRICPLSMMLHEPERAEEADENEKDSNGEKQNEGKEDRERARREELG